MTVEKDKVEIPFGGFEAAVNKFAAREQPLTDEEIHLLQKLMQDGTNFHIRTGGWSDGPREEKPLLSRS